MRKVIIIATIVPLFKLHAACSSYEEGVDEEAQSIILGGIPPGGLLIPTLQAEGSCAHLACCSIYGKDDPSGFDCSEVTSCAGANSTNQGGRKLPSFACGGVDRSCNDNDIWIAVPILKAKDCGGTLTFCRKGKRANALVKDDSSTNKWEGNHGLMKALGGVNPNFDLTGVRVYNSGDPMIESDPACGCGATATLTSQRDIGPVSLSVPRCGDRIKITIIVPNNMISGSGTTGDCGRGDARVAVSVCPPNAGCQGFVYSAGQGQGLDICHDFDQTLGPQFINNPRADGTQLIFTAVTERTSIATIEFQ
jgi:hypothetical protein